ncbi:DDE-type integrase/transposase/recombinase [Uliginosibacterium sp. 31-12]|uniref:DDE-type integrase/transposase/recombinase n=1 Tax=Uliginosibacterium sp. 31-12 TaxID=3062781 RepID=UPI0026E2D80F|nr:DDE-type integrase/transposase/recombinase [Uliginosibacterium sp. 31-12]MDO6386423.1 DDE-type integrase/transposase/recombinase [Uliginosibacterium sp. 31-12]
MEHILQLLTAGAQFEMHGCHYEVAAVRKDEVRVAPTRGGMFKNLKFKAMNDLFNDQRIKVVYTPPHASADANAVSRSALTPSQLVKLNYQLSWTHALMKRIPESPCSQDAIKRVREALHQEIGGECCPAVSTLASWMTRWIKGNRQDEALMSKPRPSRVNHTTLDARVLEIVNASIEAVYLTEHRNPISAVHADVEFAIANHNASSTEKFSAPSVETIRNIINRIDKYERDAKRYGKHYAARKHRAAGASSLASEPLEICQSDGQIMDIIVVEPNRADGAQPEELGRPYITVIIDVRTRCVLAAYVSLAPFCGATLMKTLQRAVVAEPGCPRGVMSKLIVDNGSDYRDSGFMKFCAALNVTLEPCPPKSPNGKAIVERFFRTMNEALIHKLPGTTFSNPQKRGDYKSQKHARLTLEELNKHVQTWIQGIYHHTPHRGLGRAPIAVWNEETQS